MDHIDVWIDEKWEQWAERSPHSLIMSAPSVKHLKRLLSRGLKVNTASSTTLFSPPSFLLQNCGMDGVKALMEYGRDVNNIHHGISDIGWAIQSKNLALCKAMMSHIDHKSASITYPQDYTPLEQSLLFFPGFAFELAKEEKAGFSSLQRQEEIMAKFLLHQAKSTRPVDYISHQLWKKWGSDQALKEALSQASDEEKAYCLSIISFSPTKKNKSSVKPKRRPVGVFEPPSYILNNDHRNKHELFHLYQTAQSNEFAQFIQEKKIDVNCTPERGLPLAFEMITRYPKGANALVSFIDWHHENNNKDTISMQYIRYVTGYSRDGLTKNEEQVLRLMIKNTGINHQNSEGRTMLMTAVSSLRKVEDYLLLDLLLSYKPDLFLTDKQGLSIQDYLKKAKSDSVNDEYFRRVHASFTKKLIDEALKPQFNLKEDKAVLPHPKKKM